MQRSRFGLVCLVLGASACAGLMHVACASTVVGTGAADSLGGAAGESSSGGGSASGGDGQGGQAGDSGGPDETAPTVVSISPEDGEKGVADNAQIVIVFSEPMDQVSVEAAYASDDLPKADVEFEWNEAGDTLTITPKDPLEYAEGSDPFGVVAKAYALSLGQTAEDLAGNALAEAGSTTFTTKRALYAELDYVPALTGGYDSDNVAQAGFVMGDTASNVERKFFLSFDRSTLAEGAEITSATLGLDQIGVNGTPYPSLGTVVAVPLEFNSLGGAYFDANGLSSPLPLSTGSVLDRKFLDLTEPLAASIAADSQYFQLRFEFSFAPTPDSQGAYALFELSSMTLAVLYTAD